MIALDSLTYSGNVIRDIISARNEALDNKN